MSIRVRVLSLAIALMAFVPAAALAQMSPVSVGIKGGINSATLTTDGDDDELEQLLGGVGGVFIGRDISPNFGMQLEGLFSRRGAKFANDIESSINLHYIDVPVLARFGGANSTGSTRFFAFTGPQASFNIKSEIELLGLTEDLDDEIKAFDFGWVIGAGVDMQRITFDARYTHGLMNINDAADDNDTVKNRTFSVMVGYRFK